MRQGRLIATGVMLVFCVFAMWQSLLLSLTDRLGPGPGFFPFWLGADRHRARYRLAGHDVPRSG